MADKIRWLLSELRARSFGEDVCYKEGEGVTIVVNTERGTGFTICRFERKWHLGACARRGATYVLPDDGDIVAACVGWAEGWARTPPAETGWGAPAPPEAVAQFGLRQLGRTEIKAWFDALTKQVARRLGGE